MSRTTEKFEQIATPGGFTLYSLGARCTTVEEVIAKGQVDLDVWEVASYKINTYEVGMRVDERVEGKRQSAACVVPMTSVRVAFKKRTGLDAVKADQFLKDVAEAAPKKKALKRRDDSSYCLEISIPDFHLSARGVHSLPPERLFSWTIENLLWLSRGYAVEQILFPIGNDFCHSDFIDTNSTTSGTQLENVELGWYEAFTRGLALLVSSIDRLRKRAPVVVPCVPGNHDKQTSIAMAHVLEAYYRNTPDVTVLVNGETRQYHEYGVNLIGFEHGKLRGGAVRYAAIMAAEQPEAWARTKYREWHLGDQHRAATFEECGVGVKYLPSLVSPDKWHRDQGYIGTQNSATAFLWSRDLGPVAQYRVNAVNSLRGGK